jgi:uridine phosphorylase
MARLEETDLPDGDAEHTLHLNPAAEFHPNVLLPGDPARAMAIATANLTEPRMFNHRRGLWGYSGRTEDGVGIVVQSSGMGGPSAAIVVEELCDLGARLIIRVGTCAALDPAVKLGDIIVPPFALCMDGASLALRASASPIPDPEGQGKPHPWPAGPEQAPSLARRASDEVVADEGLGRLLVEWARAGGRTVHEGAIATVDLFYEPDAERSHRQIRERGGIGLEMEAATVFAVAQRRGVRAACLLGVTDRLIDDEPRERLPHDEITELGADIGAVAVGAVARAAG